MHSSEAGRRLIGLVLAVLGLLLECLAGWALLGDDAELHAVALPLHAIAAAAGAIGTWQLLPLRSHDGSWKSGLAYLYSAQLFVPLFGALGSLLVLLPFLHRYPPRAEGTWERRGEVDLPFKPIEVTADAVFKRVGLASMARYLGDQGLRRRVVMATRHLSGYRAVPILREALADPSDEVRLLAYSMLTGKERSFEVEIQRLQRELAQDDGSRRDWLHEQIASLYWEQAALGLVDGEVQTYVLHQAARHVDLAMEVRITGARHLLRAKVFMRLNRLAAAETSFVEARRLGVSDGLIVPFRAELAFRRRDFDTLGAELDRLGPRMRRLPQLAPVVAYWR